MIPAFRAIRSSVKDITRLQDALSKVFNAIQKKQILDGRLISDIEIATGTVKEVQHGLQRQPRGWIIVKKNAEATVWETSATLPVRTINLNASADVTISLWIF